MGKSSIDRWTAAQCLAYYGECDSDVVGEIIWQLLNAEDTIRQQRAIHLLTELSQSSVSVSVCQSVHKFLVSHAVIASLVYVLIFKCL